MLSGQETIRVCTTYRTEDDALLERYPYHQTVLHHVTPEYDELPGWEEDITSCRTLEGLQAAQDYIAYVEEGVGVPIEMIGVGPAQDEVVWTQGPAASPTAASCRLSPSGHAPASRARPRGQAGLTACPRRSPSCGVRWDGAAVAGGRSRAARRPRGRGGRSVSPTASSSIWGDDPPANTTKALQVVVSRTHAPRAGPTSSCTTTPGTASASTPTASTSCGCGSA